MIRVKVMVPEMETPYFDGNIKETNYDEFKEFLEELKNSFGEIDCEAKVVAPETTDKEDSEEESDPIAEHIKNHPIVNKTDPKMKEFFERLDNINTDENLLNELDQIEEDSPKEVKENLEDEEFDSNNYCKVLVNVEKHVLTDIYYRETPEIKKNAVDTSYPVFDSITEQIVVPIPKVVLEKCTPYNICQFIKQNTIFILMDPEYCEIPDEDLDKVFCNDDFDDSYCYDTGVYEIKIDSVQFPCDSSDSCLGMFVFSKIMKYFEQMREIDYREMEKVYITLRKFNKE